MLEKIKKTVKNFIFLSLLLHTFAYFGLSLPQLGNKELKKADTIEFVVLDNQKSKQIVEQDKNRVNDETPDKEAFLGRHNQRMEQETRAQKNGKFSNQAGQNGQKQQMAKREAPKNKSQKLAKGELPTLKSLKPQFDLTPSDNNKFVAQKAGEESKTSDHLQDIQTGVQTLLNTREFVYYAYYQRIREKIRQYWEPIIRQKVKKVFASGRSIASSRDRITKVVLVLNSEGNLIKVKVIGQSGVTDLDDAAVEAFKAAAPFPNPPKGIAKEDGTIEIRWDFVLEARKQPKIKARMARVR